MKVRFSNVKMDFFLPLSSDRGVAKSKEGAAKPRSPDLDAMAGNVDVKCIWDAIACSKPNVSRSNASQ